MQEKHFLYVELISLWTFMWFKKQCLNLLEVNSCKNNVCQISNNIFINNNSIDALFICKTNFNTNASTTLLKKLKAMFKLLTSTKIVVECFFLCQIIKNTFTNNYTKKHFVYKQLVLLYDLKKIKDSV